MSIGPFNFNRPFDSLKTQQPKQPATLRQKRTTYRRLWLICEIYKPEWRAVLERAEVMK